MDSSTNILIKGGLQDGRKRRVERRGIVKGIDFTGLCQVSTFGNVKFLDRTIIDKRGVRQSIKGQTIEPKLDRGYLRIALSKNGKRVYTTVHQLELQTFKPNPDPKIYTQVNHIDENPSNNHLDNLEWCTAEENNNHGTRKERAIKTRRRHFVPTVQLDLKGNIINVYYQKEDIETQNKEMTFKHVARSINKEKNICYGYFWIKLDKYNELTQNELLSLINEKVEQNNFGKMHGGITQREMVAQMDLNGNTIKEFESVSAAAQELNCHYQAISQCASGKIKTCCGYRWKYLNK